VPPHIAPSFVAKLGHYNWRPQLHISTTPDWPVFELVLQTPACRNLAHKNLSVGGNPRRTPLSFSA